MTSTRRKVLPAAAGTAQSAAFPDDVGNQPHTFGLHTRWVAVAAGAGVCAHLAMVGAGGWMAFAALAMALPCLRCAAGMWRAPSLRTARMIVAMSIGMALLHAAVLLGVAPVSGHSHGAGPVSTAVLSADVAGSVNEATTTHAVPMLVAMGVDFAASMLSAAWIRRRLSP